MIQIRIIGIRKSSEVLNDHSSISHYQWQDETGHIVIWGRTIMVNWILENPREHAVYVRDSRGDVAYCKVVRNQYGTLFLETYPDQTLCDNLLSLPQI